MTIWEGENWFTTLLHFLQTVRDTLTNKINDVLRTSDCWDHNESDKVCQIH